MPAPSDAEPNRTTRAGAYRRPHFARMPGRPDDAGTRTTLVARSMGARLHSLLEGLPACPRPGGAEPNRTTRNRLVGRVISLHYVKQRHRPVAFTGPREPRRCRSAPLMRWAWRSLRRIGMSQYRGALLSIGA